MKKIFLLLFFAFSLGACGSFDGINTNPDAPTRVTPDYLAAQLILQLTYSQSRQYYGFTSDSWLMKTTSYEEEELYLYNKVDREDFSGYANMTDAKKMDELTDADTEMPEGKKDAYHGLANFVRAWYLYGTTMPLGDVPCSDAIKGESEGLFTPKYDTQEEVFATIIKQLRQSSLFFAKASTFSGDPAFNGDADKWLRTVNTFTLRVLNMLSKKSTVGEYDVKSLFEQVAAEPLMRDENDNLQRVYSASKSDEWYPLYKEHYSYYNYSIMSSFLVDMMTDLKDNRLFYYAEPTPNAITQGLSASSFESYKGVSPVLEYGQIQAAYASGETSSLNKRYYLVPQGEPFQFISYSELQFIMAEAALRGWKTTFSAKQYYENGVRAAMKFTAENTPDEYKHGVNINDDYINSYLQGKAAFSEQKGLEQIMVQKLIGSFLQLKFNSFWDYRRTGYPNIPINPDTNLNDVKTQMPLRWMYPEKEYTNNSKNVEDAVQRQFGGKDTPNEVMWLLK